MSMGASCLLLGESPLLLLLEFPLRLLAPPFAIPLEGNAVLSVGLSGECDNSGSMFSDNLGSDLREYSGRRRRSRFHFVVGSCFVDVCFVDSSGKKSFDRKHIIIKLINPERNRHKRHNSTTKNYWGKEQREKQEEGCKEIKMNKERLKKKKCK